MQKKTLFTLLTVLLVLCLLATLFIRHDRTAPGFSATTMDGKLLTSAELQGKVMLINFWATSCTGCVKEVPELIKLQNRFGKKDFETIGIALDYDDPAYINRFIGKFGINYAVIHDKDGQIAEKFGKISLAPTSFVIDKKGKIVRKIIGEVDMAEMEKTIESLL
ncbi:Thiol-disulfide oxidoreductase ResA [Andreprevotia sp. IGB-42]|uniref:TlpA disulfide reductase family protein n=1 Tax=Andreprevotia sp. IGB-42 TaxID=2497473 RepID=UPI00135CA163|nr:TlpA disulfide reductase family protein [Andreprevotia sp. IGB-42]KAF0812444.1 Thiol-disulfide oxidoreductase ResA [Andreprevotia sp. IGB-42]